MGHDAAGGRSKSDGVGGATPLIALDAVVVRQHPDDLARAVVAISYALVATKARDGIELSIPVGGGVST